MSDSNARINVAVSRELKRKLKRTILDAGIDSMQKGYVTLLQKGMEKLIEDQNKKSIGR